MAPDSFMFRATLIQVERQSIQQDFRNPKHDRVQVFDSFNETNETDTSREDPP